MTCDNDEVINDYDEWLEKTGCEDSEETRGWFDCADGEQADYIENHPDWWKNF